MRLRKFELVMKVVRIILILAMFLLCATGITTDRGQPSPLVIFSFIIGYIILWVMLICHVPVICNKPGCRSRMKPNWERLNSKFEIAWRLSFTCPDCGHVYY